jgi:hypothetical protein
MTAACLGTGLEPATPSLPWVCSLDGRASAARRPRASGRDHDSAPSCASAGSRLSERLYIGASVQGHRSSSDRKHDGGDAEQHEPAAAPAGAAAAVSSRARTPS